MPNFTHYLTVLEDAQAKSRVRIESGTPLAQIEEALQSSKNLRYSPILPAYLSPTEDPQDPPTIPSSIAFFFASKPYQSLGGIKPGLTEEERHRVFFTEGLASIVMINCDETRARSLKTEIGCPQTEFWKIRRGVVSRQNISVWYDDPSRAETLTLGFSPTGDPAIDVYIEQISASITTLWAYYGVHFPEERNTLRQILAISQRLVQLRMDLLAKQPTITRVRQENAIISGLVELSASLSYSVTQGTTGASPILDNRSPFPHHSLLGVGGSIRAITKFIRYLEKAFKRRSAADVISRHYVTKTAAAPVRISNYMSGPPYSFDVLDEEFDTGGDFISAPDVPLLAHYSLRHGFKEAKFSVTAASESLTAECLPPWTLMTLSHETMHSRVRHIFQALFGTTWENDNSEEQWDRYFAEFSTWFKSKHEPLTIPLSQAIRNVVLHFCLMTEREEIVSERRPISLREIDRDDLLNAFFKHKRLATELFVHFHDYYFAYACQPKLYVMSLWASWTTVAAPVAHTPEYLVRTLATIACGTGSTPRAAFNGAVDTLEDGLAALEAAGIESAIFQELRSLLSEPNRRAMYAFFRPAYYLIDHVRKYFASRIIAENIDRLDEDPFAEGSTIADQYSASIYVHGEQQSGILISPIRYSLAALVRQLSGQRPAVDLQWLTAWNSMVISSQEV